MEEKKTNCAFATIVETGEKPVAEIHAATFDRDDKLELAVQVNGSGAHLVHAATHIVGHLLKTIEEKDGPLGAMVFAMGIIKEIPKNLSDRTMNMMCASMDMLNLIGDALKSDDDEEDDDGEPV